MPINKRLLKFNQYSSNNGLQDLLFKFLWIIYLGIAMLAWLQLSIWHVRDNNNFDIFINAFRHIIHHQPLYIVYPEYWDLFLYHPVFAMLFAPFAILPSPLNSYVWLFVSTLTFLWTISNLPLLNKKWKIWILVLSIFEFEKNIMHAQTNILIACGMVLSFVLAENRKTTVGVFANTLNFCIKGFGAITSLLMLLYPKSGRSVLQGIVFTIILSILPLIVLSPKELLQCYADWLTILKSDTITESLSSYSFLINTLHLPKSSETILMLFGVALLLLYWVRLWQCRFAITTARRAHFLSFLLLWVVVFNRAAESPTYIFAITGLLIWYFFNQQTNSVSSITTFVFILSFVWIAVVPSDLTIPALKQMDRTYCLRPLFAFVPLMWIWVSEFNLLQKLKPTISKPI
jgi:Glycosyltransferase family 87